MKKTETEPKNSRRGIAKKNNARVLGVRKNGRSAFARQSYVSKYSRAVSFLYDLEEQEIEIMVASSTKVSSSNK